jgi:3-deoxy-D-manno-octulosonic-acid transferase
MAWMENAYALGLTALRPLLALASRGEGKLARGIRGRRETLARMADWSAQRDASRPLVWLHASSVGEGLQGRAVLEAFRRRNPAVQIAYTFFSPSAEALASSMPADFVGYLPYDAPRETASALDLLRPDVIAFSKNDVWPVLTARAAQLGSRLALLSATLPPSSSRLRGPARRLLQPAYQRLDRVAAISDQDARRFEELGVSAPRLSVMGDAHFDRVLARAESVDRESGLLRQLAPGGGDVTLVAGSTWPQDEDRLIPMVAAIRQEPDAPRLRLVLVPHEPSPEHLAASERRLDRSGLPHRRLSELDGAWNGDEVLLVDRVGVLGQLYAVADLGYVGGAWGRAGIHSVLEPAGFGLAIVFGPRHGNAREAAELVERGGAHSASDTAELRARIGELVRDGEARRAAGAASRDYVRAGRGASERGAALLEELVRQARR